MSAHSASGFFKRLPLYAAIIAVGITCALGYAYGNLARGGLSVSVWSLGPQGPSAVHQGIDTHLSADAVTHLISRVSGPPVRINWNGFIRSPRPGDYRFHVPGDAPVRVWIDNRAVFERRGSGDSRAVPARLSAEPSRIAVEYSPTGEDTAFELQWDGSSPYRMAPVPVEILSPSRLSRWAWSVRARAPAVAGATVSLWSILILGVLTAPVWRFGARGSLHWTPSLVAVFGAAAVVVLTGISWKWAPDEVDPAAVLSAIDLGFANGWHDKYPPLHYYLLALVSSPAIAADSLGWLGSPPWALGDLMWIQGRVLTAAMAMAALIGVAALATRLLGRDHAWAAVFCAVVFLPFPFYAKTANLDVPYLCWFIWSVWFLVELYETGHRRPAVLFGMTAAAAIATKDQAYGLYVLPALLLIWRFGRNQIGWTTLMAGGVAGLVTLALSFNVVFNFQGFLAHISTILGPASTGYRMYPPHAAGQWELFVSTAGQVVRALGVGGLVLVGAGIGSERYAPAARAFALMALCLVSYYLTFVAVVGYVYDRFLLPATTLLALCASIGVLRLLKTRFAGVAPRLGAAVLLLWMFARAASVTVLMARDSRFAAEQWLLEHVRRDDVVASVDQFGYVPRLEAFNRVQIQPTIEDTLAVQPRFIVVNREFVERFLPGSPQPTWMAWLESGASPFHETFRYKAGLWWSPLRWDDRFTDRREDLFSNMDKANPEIVIFERQR